MGEGGLGKRDLRFTETLGLCLEGGLDGYGACTLEQR